MTYDGRGLGEKKDQEFWLTPMKIERYLMDIKIFETHAEKLKKYYNISQNVFEKLFY